MSANDDLTITVNVKDLTPTELILEVQKLSWYDPEINVKMAATLRKIADGIESRKVGVQRLNTSVTRSRDGYPGATFEIDFSDFDHEEKSRQKIKDDAARKMETEPVPEADVVPEA